VSTWEYWYSDSRKQRTIEPEVANIERLLRGSKGRTVLDYGCGTGRHTAYMASKGFDVYGFDLSRGAISRTRALLRARKLRANLRVWDMTRRLPYEISFFEGIICTMVMHHAKFRTIIREAGEIDRVLASGGYLFLQVERRAEVMRWVRERPEAHTVIEPGTVVPLEAPEKGVPHHGFTRRELSALFPNYDFLKLHSGTKHYRGLCLIARKAGN
jgi:SAM-dependent methyltransferase